MNINYKDKYEKYKNKYLDLKNSRNIKGGNPPGKDSRSPTTPFSAREVRQVVSTGTGPQSSKGPYPYPRGATGSSSTVKPSPAATGPQSSKGPYPYPQDAMSSSSTATKPLPVATGSQPSKRPYPYPRGAMPSSSTATKPLPVATGSQPSKRPYPYPRGAISSSSTATKPLPVATGSQPSTGGYPQLQDVMSSLSPAKQSILKLYLTDMTKTQGKKTQGEKTQGEKTQGEKTQGEKTQGEKTQGEIAQDEIAQTREKLIKVIFDKFLHSSDDNIEIVITEIIYHSIYDDIKTSLENLKENPSQKVEKSKLVEKIKKLDEKEIKLFNDLINKTDDIETRDSFNGITQSECNKIYVLAEKQRKFYDKEIKESSIPLEEKLIIIERKDEFEINMDKLKDLCPKPPVQFDISDKPVVINISK